MATASRILGDEVGSTAPGLPGVPRRPRHRRPDRGLTGAVAALARKGSPRHIRAGRWSTGRSPWSSPPPPLLAAMRWAQDYYLFILGAMAFTAATIGYLHRRRHRPGDTGHIAGMGIAYTAMLTAFYVDNGPHLPLWDRLPDPRLLDPALRHRRAHHHARDHPRQEYTAPSPATEGRRPDHLLRDARHEHLARAAYREHGHGSLFPGAGDSTVSVGLGGSRYRDCAPGRP